MKPKTIIYNLQQTAFQRAALFGPDDSSVQLAADMAAGVIELSEQAERLETALADAISTYTGGDKLVTSERQEAWISALINYRKTCK